ncbi:MAG: tetratricopeptide repeat-containing sensor histidine kinase [Bacteroidota bacterium]
MEKMDSASYVFNQSLRLANRFGSDFLANISYLGLTRVQYFLGDYDSAVYFTRRCLYHSQQADFTHGIIGAYNALGTMLPGDSSTYYKVKTLDLALAENDTILIFDALYNLAVHYQDGKDYKKSLQYNIRALKISEFMGYFQYAISCDALSHVYTALEDYERALLYANLAIESHQKSLAEGELEASTGRYILSYLRISSIYNLIDSTETARYFLRKAMVYFDSSSKGEDKTEVFVRYADSYRLEGNLDSALYYAVIAKKLGIESGVDYEVMESNLAMAKIHSLFSNSDSAAYYANVALGFAEEESYYDKVEEAVQILYESYDRKKEKELALLYLKKLMAVRDTLGNEDRLKSVTRTSMQFEFDQEKRQLAFEKEKETLLLNQQIDRQRAIQYGAFGGIVLLLIIFYGYYRNYKNKQKDHQKIAEQAQELQVTNEKLNELSKYKEGLSHMIVHDMKNPLNVILGLTDDKIPNAEKSRLINESAKLILQLAHDIIDIQKFEEAKMQLEQEVYSVQEVVLYAEEQLDLMMKVKNMSFENQLSENFKASFDLRLISRVLVNLFTNAVKHSPVGSRLIVQVKEQTDGFLKISVADQGQGIPEDQLPYIFDKFWQVYSKNSAETYSSGLGLTFCRLAIQAHGGTIEAKSTLGQGSEFIVVLPIGDVNQQAVAILDQVSVEEPVKDDFYSEEEQELMKKVIAQIVDVPIYKAGVINKILDNTDSKSEKIADWIQMIKFAVMSWDQQRFNDLLRLDNNETQKTGTYD